MVVDNRFEIRDFLRSVLSRYVVRVPEFKHDRSDNHEEVVMVIQTPMAYIPTNYIAMDIQAYQREGWDFEFVFKSPQAIPDSSSLSSIVDRDTFGQWAEMQVLISGVKTS